MEEQCQFVFEAAELWCVRWQVELSRRKAQAQELPWVCCLAVAELTGVLVWVRDGRPGCSGKALCAHFCAEVFFSISFHYVRWITFASYDVFGFPCASKCVVNVNGLTRLQLAKVL